MTAALKSKLRRKNRLMTAGRVEEANSLAEHIGKDITQCCKKLISLIDGRVDAKGMWAVVRQLTGRQQDTHQVDGVTAESLNEHYATISTDSKYQAPARKQSVAQSQSNLPNMELTSEWRMFRLLDKLRSTAAGLDQMPAWFLRLGAPVFYKPLTRLFNLSIATSTVPVQWKVARIRTIPKVSLPSCNADFRPISVTQF